mmetsp:Transcript_76477/g.212417  ORF Transcript_76477/g.212417 Transcript_76477/m.212417 type:complete len:254 (-) Transcript_76477:840-1601(-)
MTTALYSPTWERAKYLTRAPGTGHWYALKATPQAAPLRAAGSNVVTLQPRSLQWGVSAFRETLRPRAAPGQGNNSGTGACTMLLGRDVGVAHRGSNGGGAGASFTEAAVDAEDPTGDATDPTGFTADPPDPPFDTGDPKQGGSERRSRRGTASRLRTHGSPTEVSGNRMQRSRICMRVSARVSSRSVAMLPSRRPPNWYVRWTAFCSLVGDECKGTSLRPKSSATKWPETTSVSKHPTAQQSSPGCWRSPALA